MTSYLEIFNLVYFEITTRECKSMRYNQNLVLLLLWFCTMQDKLAFFHKKKEYMKSLKQFQLPWIYHMYLHILLEFGWNVDIQNFGCMWLFMFSTYSFSYIFKTFWKGLKRHVVETFSSFHGVFQLVSHLIPLDWDFASHMLI